MSKILKLKKLDILNELRGFGLEVDIYDPPALKDEVKHEFNLSLTDKLSKYKAIILAVSHGDFKRLDLEKLKDSSGAIIYDIKSFLNKVWLMEDFKNIDMVDLKPDTKDQSEIDSQLLIQLNLV